MFVNGLSWERKKENQSTEEEFGVSKKSLSLHTPVELGKAALCHVHAGVYCKSNSYFTFFIYIHMFSIKIKIRCSIIHIFVN
jgi:hypothetical protein